MADLSEILANYDLPGHHIQAILRRVKNYPKIRLDTILSDFSKLYPADIAKILSEHLNIPLLNWSDIEVAKIPTSHPQLAPKSVAAVPIKAEDGKKAIIAVAHPQSQETKDLVNTIYAATNEEAIIMIADRITREKVFQIFQPGEGVFDNLRKNIHAAEIKTNNDNEVSTALTKIISEILYAAAILGASDIQFTATETFGTIIMKIQGTGHIAAEFRRITYDKIMRLFIGSINVPAETIKKKSVEVGITNMEGVDQEIFQLYNFRAQVTMPEASQSDYTVATIRLLARSINIVSFADAGFNDKEISEIKHAVNSTTGLILLVGPVNSGKSTTLYTMMISIDSIRRLVKTIENPIEFRAPMWEQNNLVSTDTVEEELAAYRDQTKAMVRKSPDCLLAGELRTVEEAKQIIGLAYASTLCFSSLHAGTVADAFDRLNYWQVGAYDLANVVRLVIAQRLIRKLCKNCKIKEEQEHNLAQVQIFKKQISDNNKTEIYAANRLGCGECSYTGFNGRLLIAEILAATHPDFRSLVLACDQDSLNKAIYGQKSSLWHSGMRHVLAGDTSVGELVRNIGRVPINKIKD